MAFDKRSGEETPEKYQGGEQSGRNDDNQSDTKSMFCPWSRLSS